MVLHIQTYLRNGGTVNGLSTEFGITAKRHHTHPVLILFKYSMIDSPMSNPIVQECRGIILNESDDWAVVARAFDKFFNYGEGNASIINWETARVQEKLDGSLCLVFYYKDEWHVATSGTPDASGGVNNTGKSFADYFWQTLGCKPEDFQCTKSDMCFIWELMGPDNRIVVVHNKPRVVLLGARIRTTGLELSAATARIYLGMDSEVEIVKEFPLQSIEDIFATFDKMSPLQQEGYVIVWTNTDGSFGRNKTKHPGYVAIHHAKDGWTNKSCVEVVRSGEMTEVTATVLAMYPEYKTILDTAKERYDALLASIEAEYIIHKDIPVQKDFALAVKSSRCSAALFHLRSGKSKNVRKFLAKCNLDSLMQMLGY